MRCLVEARVRDTEQISACPSQARERGLALHQQEDLSGVMGMLVNLIVMVVVALLGEFTKIHGVSHLMEVLDDMQIIP